MEFKMGEKAKKCDITPDISLMKKMASISGTILSRIMELVDNSIDAKVPNKVLEIDVNIVKRGSRHYIEVIDNGMGMTELAARSFFRLGDSKKEGKKMIGKFGLGSKVAILGLGDTCKIRTYPLGEKYSIDMYFDIHRFKEWNIHYKVSPKDEEIHGTRIRIEDITVRLGNINRLAERLHEAFAGAYKHFIESGEVVVRINGQEVLLHQVELLPDLYKKFDFEVNGKRVYGWAGAMKEAGTNWKFGFNLISNGRIIKANDLLGKQAHTSLARLTGEIHLNDFATDIHKTDFIRHVPDFEEMQETLLNEYLGDLITKIAKLTNREVFTKYQEEMSSVSQMLNKVIRNYDFLNHIDIEEGIFKHMKKRVKPKVQSKPELVEETNEEQELEEIVDLFGDLDAMFGEENEEEKEEEVTQEKKKRQQKAQPGLVINEPIGISAGEEQPAKRWMAEETENQIFLNVEVNLDHPTYQTEEEKNIAIHMKNAVLESLAEFILREEKKYTGLLEDEIERFNRIKDMIVRYSVAI